MPVMQTASNNTKRLDRKKLLDDCDGEASFANRCLQIYVRETQGDIDAISAAFSDSDLAKVSRLAHRIKGASATIRAAFLRDEAALLNQLGGKGKEFEAAASFARLRAEFDDFKEFVATLPRLSDGDVS
jgi:HPt (histidine-containing phosphotransfer) domain-containing protein